MKQEMSLILQIRIKALFQGYLKDSFNFEQLVIIIFFIIYDNKNFQLHISMYS